MRAVSVLEVADDHGWAEVAAAGVGPESFAEALDAHRRVVAPGAEATLLDRLAGKVLVRYARRSAAEIAADDAHVRAIIDALRHDVRRVLYSAQRHAHEGEVIGRQAWDPAQDAGAVRALLGAGLLLAVPDGAPPFEGRHRLPPDLPDPPAIAYEFTEAVMDDPGDLAEPAHGPLALIHDVAALAAAIEHHPPKITWAGTVGKAEGRRIGRQLGDAGLAATGDVDTHVRWGRALRALQALHAVSVDPVTRIVELDPGLEIVLAGDTATACDRLVHRLVDRDLHVVVPAVRAALRAAGSQAIDEVIFMDLVREQHRDLLLPRWVRAGRAIYPHHDSEPELRYDDDGFETVERPMIRAALTRMARFGLIRRGGGVFAGTADGRAWAGHADAAPPPIWVSGDLEIIVPPGSLTPNERFQVERLSRCLQRDTVDRYRIERALLTTWMSTHDEGEMLDLLERRAPGLPASVPTTLRAWAAAARRCVLTRGVVLPPSSHAGNDAL